MTTRRAFLAAGIAALSISPGLALAQSPIQELKIMAPAGPGGGWDGAARSIQQVLTETKAVRSVQVNNVTGAGGTIGLAQFINNAKGRPQPVDGQWHHDGRRHPDQQIAR